MTHLHPADTAELTDLLRFVRDWLNATTDDTLNDSLSDHLAMPGGYDTAALACDIDRFVVLLDGTADGDGATVFTTRT